MNAKIDQSATNTARRRQKGAQRSVYDARRAGQCTVPTTANSNLQATAKISNVIEAGLDLFEELRFFQGEGELQQRHAYSRQNYAIVCEPSVEGSWCLSPFASLLPRKCNVKSEVELRRLGHDVVPSCQSAQADASHNVCAETSTSSLLVVTVWCSKVVKYFFTVETRDQTYLANLRHLMLEFCVRKLRWFRWKCSGRKVQHPVFRFWLYRAKADTVALKHKRLRISP